MKSNRKMTLLVGLAAICFAASSLKASDLVGSFTLPSETHWGTVVLPAGDYTFTLDRATLDGRIRIARGNNRRAIVMAQGINLTSRFGGSSMLIVGNRVRSVHLAPVGLT